jgi:hypothetical protein
MVLQVFEVLFVVTLGSLVLAVPFGLALLAWPRSTRATHGVAAPHAASARV